MRMTLSFVVMAAIAGVFAGSMQKPARASGGLGYPEYGSSRIEEALFNSPSNRKMWIEYYAEHVKVRLGPEQRLPNGVSWRLLIDQRTGIAMPRITWMPDRKSMAVANRMLDVLHGRAVEGARAEADYSLALARQIVEEKPYLKLSELEWRPFTRSVVQADIALTYVTANFVSLVELADVMLPGANFNPRKMQGLILDLRRDLLLVTGACPERKKYDGRSGDGAFFQVGDLLQFCDEASLDAFGYFVHEKAKPALAAAVSSKDSFIKRCRKPYLAIDQRFVFFLTPGGLAVHATDYWVHAIMDCALRRSSVGTFIIPYRELEPFMKPGPLRDELLRQ